MEQMKLKIASFALLNADQVIASEIIDQVKNGVAIRMAVLYQLLGGAALTREVSA